MFNGEHVPWSLTAYAICVDEDALDGWDIVSEPAFDWFTDSPTFAQSAAKCPDGTVAYSAGARIDDPFPFFSGRIGLQLIRTSGSLDIGRATARENTPLGTPSHALRSVSVSMAGPEAPAGGVVASQTCAVGGA